MRDHDRIFLFVHPDAGDVRSPGGESGERLRRERGRVRRAVLYPDEGRIFEPPQGLAQGVRQALLGVRDERAALLGSREPVDYLPAAARVAGFWNAPDDTLARRRRVGRARLSVVLLLIMKNPVEISVDWQHRRTATGLLRRRGVFPGHIERINPLLATGG